MFPSVIKFSPLHENQDKERILTLRPNFVHSSNIMCMGSGGMRMRRCHAIVCLFNELIGNLPMCLVDASDRMCCWLLQRRVVKYCMGTSSALLLIPQMHVPYTVTVAPFKEK